MDRDDVIEVIESEYHQPLRDVFLYFDEKH